jgi:hypothetical protein
MMVAEMTMQRKTRVYPIKYLAGFFYQFYRTVHLAAPGSFISGQQQYGYTCFNFLYYLIRHIGTCLLVIYGTVCVTLLGKKLQFWFFLRGKNPVQKNRKKRPLVGTQHLQTAGEKNH